MNLKGRILANTNMTTAQEMTQEMIEVMQAFADGKQIQVLGKLSTEWEDTRYPIWNWSCYDYRIKPEEPKLTYRPYESPEEMADDYCNRFDKKYWETEMPLIWVQSPKQHARYLIMGFSDYNEAKVGDLWERFNDLLEDYTYLDGSPCGKWVK